MYARNVLRTRESTRFHRMWKTLFPSVRIESQSTCTIWNPIFFFSLHTRIYRTALYRVCSQFPSWFMIMIIGQISIIMAENNIYMPFFGRKYPLTATDLLFTYSMLVFTFWDRFKCNPITIYSFVDSRLLQVKRVLAAQLYSQSVR